ncbi:OBAP family protein [Xanthomonas sp. NCPPB 2654]|uniref:OBAP family protein n=1 Tax=unclassified Xanthomonas TaxID=2643310 RepID=UPI0021DFEDEB|nr:MULTISPECIES: OBAP family protein [unclassified Xanthomonas]MDL5366116.1 OBAP family protein [Xanthomonas sp. NCPPB 2654]UYC20813.1 OBAP family protein [Xanthomonas sp. CFBP 8443]
MRTTLLAPLLLALAACSRDNTEPATHPPGAEETAKTDMLEAGAKALQGNGPLAKLDIHLVGFHPMKDHPHQQMEAHHFCRQVNQDFAQCALFDGDSAQANLTGVEYIISETLFQRLPPEERGYWHPHNGEILSGQLSAPGLPLAAEKELMRTKMNSYGKTWHTWHTRDGAAPGDAMPTGEAMLAWSFNRDGELQPSLQARRDKIATHSAAELRADRKDLTGLAKPQEGVDLLRPAFPNATPIPGVVDARASKPK